MSDVREGVRLRVPSVEDEDGAAGVVGEVVHAGDEDAAVGRLREEAHAAQAGGRDVDVELPAVRVMDLPGA